ncbi:MAG: succinyl-diaminopimelate desuccinylase [Sphingomonadaceae bacterium]|nr:succinyl-diaminopimelate desuccinylase [Sphingomonadaceae bacterium]
MADAIELAKALIACPSITPAHGAVFDVLEEALTAQGFEVERFVAGEPPDGPVENLLATRGSDEGPHFAFAGHLDVVPPGEGWSGDPFAGEVRSEMLHGRGAVDMKSAIAAFTAAAGRVRDHAGRITLVITGDEEGPATYGTVALIERMRARGLIPDFCLVGEPTSAARLGDTIKVGRRGSVNIWIEVAGTQGHVAYPGLADNPIPALVRILTAIDAIRLDEGSAWFQPSNIEPTTVDVGNPATNVIPAKASARLSIRFNEHQRGEDLVDRIRRIAEAESPRATVTARIYGEAFLTPPGPLSDLIAAAVREVTGLSPDLSTAGGTSDARYLVKLCPVAEFGLVNATMHKLDEAAAVADIEALTDIYECVLRKALVQSAIADRATSAHDK